jgi:hypothetical protein
VSPRTRPIHDDSRRLPSTSRPIGSRRNRTISSRKTCNVTALQTCALHDSIPGASTKVSTVYEDTGSEQGARPDPVTGIDDAAASLQRALDAAIARADYEAIGRLADSLGKLHAWRAKGAK